MTLHRPTSEFSHDNALIAYDFNPIAEGLRTLVTFNIRHLPILDAGLNLVGIFTASDVLRFLHHAGDLKELDTEIGEIMVKNVITVTPDKDIVDTILTLFNSDISSTPIMRDKHIVGIFTIKDALVIDELWEVVEDTSLSHYSTEIGKKIEDGLSLTKDHSIWQVMDQISMSPENQGLVFDDSDELIGVVTVLDIMDTVLHTYNSHRFKSSYLHDTSIEEIMYHTPLLMNVPVSLKLARKLLLDHHDESVILVSNNRPRRVIGEKDFFQYLVMKLSEHL